MSAVDEAMIERACDAYMEWAIEGVDRDAMVEALKAALSTYEVATDTSGTEAVAWMVVCVGSRHMFFDRADAELFAGDPSSRIVPLFTRSAPDGDGASREKGKGVSDER